MKYITNPTDIPKGTQYAALVSDSVYIPGDERSKTNPGHGYPAENKSIIQFICFADQNEMKEWVKKRESAKSYGQKPYKIIEFTPLEVAVSVSVEFPKATR